MQPLLTPLTSTHGVYIGRYRFEFREPFGNPVSYCQILERCCINRPDFDRIVKARLEHAIRELLIYDVERIDISLDHNRAEIVRNRDFRMTSQVVISIPMKAELDGLEMTVVFHPWIPAEPPVAQRAV
jgi:hypothetical protein